MEENNLFTPNNLNLIYNSIKEPIFVINNKFTITSVNKAFTELLNLKKEDIIGKKCYKIFHESSEVWQNCPLKSIEEEIPGHIEIKYKSGGYSLNISCSPLIDNNREIIGLVNVIKKISDFVNTEEKLEKIEEKYRLITENASDLIYILNEKFKLEFINEKVHKKILGYTKDEVIGKDAIKFVHLDDLAFVIEKSKENWEKGEGTFEFRLRGKDGNYRWIELKSKKFINKDGKSKILNIGRDISDHKRAEEKLKESEEQFRTITEQSLMGICIVQNNSIKYANEAMSVIVEYSINEMLEWKTNDLFKLIAPDNLSYAKKEAKIVQEKKRKGITHDHYKIVTKYGKFKWVDTYAKTIKFQGKNAALVTFIDATKRIETEQKLGESEEKYRLITENTNDLIGVINDKFEIEYINQYTQSKIISYPEINIIGNYFLDLIHSDDQKRAKLIFNKFFENEEGREEFRIKQYNGTYIWFEIKGKTFLERNGSKKVLLVGRDISERKAMEELKFKKSEQKYRLITENANDLISIINENMENEFINEKIHLKTLGYSKNDLIGKVNADFIHVEDLEKVTSSFRKAIEIGEGKTEYRFKRKDGKYIWLESRGKIFTDLDGRQKGLIISRDITERKLAEQNLIESEKRYRTFIENFQGIVFQGYHDFSATFFHGAIEQLTGYTEDEFLSRSIKWDQIIHPDDREEVYKQVELFISSSEKKSNRQYRIIKKDGDVRYIAEYFQRFYDSIKNKEGVRGILIDITDEKSMENKLRESEEKYRGLIEGVSDAIISTDLKFKIISWNKAAESIYGWIDSEAIGKIMGKLCPTEYMGLKEEDVIESFFKNGSWNGEVKQVCREGKVINIYANVNLIKDENGNNIGIVAVNRDITERKKSEEKLKESEEKFRTISENSTMAIFIIQDNKVKYVNKAYEEITGYPIQEVLKWSVKELLTTVYPEDLTSVRERLRQIHSEDINLKTHYNFRVITKSGELKWIETISKNIMFQGKMSRLSLFIDISKKKEAEQRLRESEAKFRMIAEQSLMGISIIQENKIKYVNGALSNIHGYSTDEMMNWSLIDLTKFIHPEDINDVLIQIKRLQKIQIGKTSAIYRIITKAGKIKWVEVFAKIIDFEKKPAILTMIHDISEKIQARQNLKESEEKYKSLINSINDVIFQTDLKGKIKFVSPQIKVLFGYEAEELFNKNIVDFIHPKDIPNILKKIEGIIQNRKGDISLEFLARHKSGDYLTISSRGGYMPGKVPSLITVLRDITEKKKMEKLVSKQRDLASKILRTESLTELFRFAFQTIIETTDFDCGGIYIFNEDNNTLDLSYHQGLSEPFVHAVAHYDSDSPNAEIVKENRSFFLNYDDLLLAKTEAEKNEGLKSFGLVPLNFSNHTIGCINVASRTLRKISDESKKIIETIGSYISQFIYLTRLNSTLRESEKKYRNLLESLNEGIWVIDKNNHTKFVNENMAQMLGYNVEEMQGRHLFSFMDEQGIDICKSHLERRQSGIKEQHDFEFICKDGSRIYALLETSPILNDKGEYDGAIAGVIDITERRKAKEELISSKARLQFLLSSSPAVIYSADPIGDYRTTFISENVKAITGYEASEFTHQPSFWIDHVHPDDLDFVHTEINRLLSKKNHSYEYRFKCKDGNYRWFRDIMELISTSDGKSIEIVGYLADITSQKVDQQKLKESQKQLEESEKKYRNLLESLNEGIWVIDKNYKITFVNQPMADMLGYEIEELQGEHLYTFIDIKEFKISKENLELQKIINKQQHEITFTRKDGTLIYTIVGTSPILDDNENYIGSVAAVIDISELKKIEEELRKSQDKLLEKSKLAAVGQLAAGVAHGLNTPLANIALTAEYLLNLIDEPKLPFDFVTAQKELNDIKVQVQYCAKIVKNLLQFSRKVDLTIKELELNSLLTALLNSPIISSKIKFKGIKLITEMVEPINIEGDNIHLLQVFQNILNNSFDALDDIKHEPEIRIILSKTSSEAVIKFIDNGIGIKKSDLSRIFEPFFSTKDVGRGTGLGLPISKGIIEKHGGKIDIQSIYKEGTEVTITLPLSSSLNNKN